MENILNQIVLHKKKELAQHKKLIPYNKFLSLNRTRDFYSLKSALEREDSNGIIAEFKRRSPSKGWIHEIANPLDIVPEYQKAGANACSILTDQNFFGGTIDDIKSVADTIELPILRKDFIIDEYQILEAAVAGADVILLIAACLAPERCFQLAEYATKSGLEVLLEVHNEFELNCLNDSVTLVGVNNRNLKTFHTTINTSIELSEKIPQQFLKISESGISDPEDIIRLRFYGYSGFLIGESFMKTQNAGIACKEFVEHLNQYSHED